jgi:hypothetical protein
MRDQELTHLLAPDQQEGSAPAWLGLSGGAALHSSTSSPVETKAVAHGGCANLEGVELPHLSASGYQFFRPACASPPFRTTTRLEYRIDAC